MNINDTIKLFPSEINGHIEMPPSKSLSHRALICASLSKGKSIISNLIFSDDIKATMNALKHLGADFDINGSTVSVTGTKKIRYDNLPVDCNESGSTLRFLIPIFSLSEKKVIFTGKQSLIKRPQTIYQKIYQEDGNTFITSDDEIVVNGSIKARDYYLDGRVSSQFFSGLMFSLPLLKEDSYIYFTSVLESRSYIDLTIEMLENYGIEIQELENGYFIPGNQKYKAKDYYVEGDYSQSAFHLVAGTLNGFIQATNLRHDSLQGDKAIIDVLKAMKGKVIYTENGYTTSKSKTHGTTIDISNCPDLGPIICLLGSLSKGTTTIINAGRLRIKESDRIESTVSTLRSLGANITATSDTITIQGKNTLQGGVTVDSYNDHRIAMMISVASLRCKKEIILTRANSVNKSYPNFFEEIKKIGGKFVIED